MAAYPANMAAHAPCRSLAELRIELRTERYSAMALQAKAETASMDALAEHFARRIEDIDARLREIDGVTK